MSAEAAAVDRAQDDATPVALVVSHRIAEHHDEQYFAWQQRVGARLATWPGFLSRELHPPQPPRQDSWVAVQHFRDRASARAWVASADRAEMLGEIHDISIGNDEVRIVAEAATDAPAASAMISQHVEPADERAFLAWQSEISAAEARYDGFLGHRIEPPVVGVQDDWVVVVTFASAAQLDAWLDSPERAALLDRARSFAADVRLTRTSHGFGFWSRTDEQDPIFKSNLLVLLMLYPLVFLWGYLISTPLIDSQGVPFWLSLFIGNVVSTQLLGWFLVPWAFRRFRWWLRRHRGWRIELAGYLVICALYAVTLGVFAWMDALRG
jgi:uncharacterized protein